MFRVRTLIPYLEGLSVLRKEKVLPSKAFFTNKQVGRGGILPKLAEKMGYSEFGLFMEKIIEIALICAQEPLEDCLELCREYVPASLRDFFDPKDYVPVGNMVRAHFPTVPEFQVEWSQGSIVGHPDVVSPTCVYDIKTTGRFGAMRNATIYQILSYYCLARGQKGNTTTHIGLILPAQRKILTVSLETWDWKPFWKKMEGCIALKQGRETLYRLSPIDHALFQTALQQVGSHVKKDHLLDRLSYGVPLQFYLGGCGSAKVLTLPKTWSKKLKDRLSPRLFIHAPHNINLSKPTPIKGAKPEDKALELPWTCHVTRQILKTGFQAGVNGVVVHCGRRGGLETKVALEEMRKSVCTIADQLSEEEAEVCPLLIETSSGQGGELLCDPDDFADFYLSLPEDAKRKIKTVVDTQHTFSSAHEPMAFIETLVAKGVPIALIHYNDSKVPFGSKKDRHAPIGRGYIGIKSLMNVLMWAIQHQIPCIYE